MSIPTPDAETVDRIISIIRRDLMLGADAKIEVQTKLFGSDFDMDSLIAVTFNNGNRELSPNFFAGERGCCHRQGGDH
ncbi:MAG: hypothetical protein IH987_00630 [Planctomycetes bacterium]|nr:hypothetical protein [Planctomycetota bacterium]